MIFPAFKAGDSVLRGSNGGFDSHTLPPYLSDLSEVAKKEAAKGSNKRFWVRFLRKFK